ncbi:unnamed protein product [Trichogramma brassicae]|uniref:Uncharacterized protein n=1 Tax=Trichogramma brassicae TaxID=86971 RepID=A0A6H5I8R0_9HYME|nr:unnamed protein product [Trichogramma brassicae]
MTMLETSPLYDSSPPAPSVWTCIAIERPGRLPLYIQVPVCPPVLCQLPAALVLALRLFAGLLKMWSGISSSPHLHATPSISPSSASLEEKSPCPVRNWALKWSSCSHLDSTRPDEPTRGASPSARHLILTPRPDEPTRGASPGWPPFIPSARPDEPTGGSSSGARQLLPSTRLDEPTRRSSSSARQLLPSARPDVPTRGSSSGARQLLTNSMSRIASSVSEAGSEPKKKKVIDNDHETELESKSDKFDSCFATRFDELEDKTHAGLDRTRVKHEFSSVLTDYVKQQFHVVKRIALELAFENTRLAAKNEYLSDLINRRLAPSYYSVDAQGAVTQSSRPKQRFLVPKPKSQNKPKPLSHLLPLAGRRAKPKRASSWWSLLLKKSHGRTQKS